MVPRLLLLLNLNLETTREYFQTAGRDLHERERERERQNRLLFEKFRAFCTCYAHIQCRKCRTPTGVEERRAPRQRCVSKQGVVNSV